MKTTIRLTLFHEVGWWGSAAGAGCRRLGVNGLGQQCDYHHLNGANQSFCEAG